MIAWTLAALLGLTPCEAPANASTSPQQLEHDYGAPLLYGEERLLAEDVQLRKVHDRLAAACALEGRLNSGHALPADRAGLLKILSAPEFEGARARKPQLLQRLIESVSDWLSGLLELRGAEKYALITRGLVLTLALAAALGGLLRLVLAPRRRLRAAAPRIPDAGLPLDPPARHLERAHAALPTDTREALRQGLLALLSALEESHWARPDRVRTNREIAQELPARGAPPEVSARARGLLRTFDDSFYSLEPVARGDALAFIEAVEGLDARGSPR